MVQGYSQLKAGAFEEAVETFTASLAVAPERAEAFRGRALAQFQLKAWPSAASDFRRAKALNPQELDNWVGLGMSLAMDHQIYEAIEVLETLLVQHPSYVRGHIQLGLLYFKVGIITKGREQMQQALANRPTLADRRFIESVLKEQGRLDRKRYYRPDFEALRKLKEKRR
ncbi:MAG: tetratricopeptide repeat protein [Elusimicrobia bacterium]|nr:tetratricopeptide repeat protein [Elusimicrobiota bacterium]